MQIFKKSVQKKEETLGFKAFFLNPDQYTIFLPVLTQILGPTAHIQMSIISEQTGYFMPNVSAA